tara:strand:+ start:259 stop:372 length:114 start_codon:yes stop_codon:yes gene_type:complete
MVEIIIKEINRECEDDVVALSGAERGEVTVTQIDQPI